MGPDVETMLKKMRSDSKNNRISYDVLEKFRLPQFTRTRKHAYVYFYVLDPDSVMQGHPKLVRLIKKFNHIKDRKEQKEAALRFCQDVGQKLRMGWNPLIDDRGRESFTPIGKALERYRDFVQRLYEDGALREGTRNMYISHAVRLGAFNDSLARPLEYTFQLDRVFFESFLDHVYLDRNVNARTRNNYLNWLQTFSGWLKGHGYVSEDPTQGIRRLREETKERQPLEEEDMHRLQEYLNEHDPHFLLACMVHYYTLVRPKEMSFIRLRDISVKEQTLFISGKVSKNHRDAKVTLPAVVLRKMVELGVFGYPDDYFLFSWGFVPRAERANEKIFRDRWARVRKALGFPSKYKFYSLKDNGVTDVIDAVGLTVAKDQARHSNVATTNRYVRRQQLSAHAELKNYEGSL